MRLIKKYIQNSEKAMKAYSKSYKRKIKNHSYFFFKSNNKLIKTSKKKKPIQVTKRAKFIQISIVKKDYLNMITRTKSSC